VVTRDIQIRDLRQALTQRIVQEAVEDRTEDNAVLRGLVRELERRLSADSRRCATLETRLAATPRSASPGSMRRVLRSRPSAMRSGRLPGLISQSDVVLFPVDCISHDAMQAIKALCRQQSGKR